MMIAPGMRMVVTSGVKPMNSMRSRMSPTMALAAISGSVGVEPDPLGEGEQVRRASSAAAR